MGNLSKAILLMLALLGVSACRYPEDPEGTLNRVESGEMIVALLHHPPFVDLSDDEPKGVEVVLLREFAAELGVEMAFETNFGNDALHRLENGAVDIVAGGLKEDTPWKREVAVTAPYDRSSSGKSDPAEDAPRVLAVRQGENAWLLRLERFLREREASREGQGG